MMINLFIQDSDRKKDLLLRLGSASTKQFHLFKLIQIMLSSFINKVSYARIENQYYRR